MIPIQVVNYIPIIFQTIGILNGMVPVKKDLHMGWVN